MRQSFKQIAIAAAVTAATVFSAGSVLAQEATADTWLTQAHGVKSRAEVLADLAAARADGSIHAGDAGYIESVRSVQTREAVRAETVRALRNGEVSRINAAAPALELRQPATRG